MPPWFRQSAAILVLIGFFSTTVLPPAYGQAIAGLPAPGSMVGLSSAFQPPVLTGIKVFPDNPFRLEFILDKGDTNALTDDDVKAEGEKLLRYFLTALTVPESDLWVNLSPYEEERIVPARFGVTEMGRDLLAQDYLLKQITASLLYPENDIGRAFWARVYEKAEAQFGTTDIPVNTFNKVWVVPEKAVIYEDGDTAVVTESHLRVMLDEDYLALSHAEGERPPADEAEDVNALGAQIVREIVIPELTREINEGENFARLRQVYHSLILAAWYKEKIQDSLMDGVYLNRNKVEGLDIDDKDAARKIWDQYVAAFEKGVYDYIREDYDPVADEVVPRKYFSGGITAENLFNAEATIEKTTNPTHLEKLSNRIRNLGNIVLLGVGLNVAAAEFPAGAASDATSGGRDAASSTTAAEARPVASVLTGDIEVIRQDANNFLREFVGPNQSYDDAFLRRVANLSTQQRDLFREHFRGMDITEHIDETVRFYALRSNDEILRIRETAMGVLGKLVEGRPLTSDVLSVVERAMRNKATGIPAQIQTEYPFLLDIDGALSGSPEHLASAKALLRELPELDANDSAGNVSRLRLYHLAMANVFAGLFPVDRADYQKTLLKALFNPSIEKHAEMNANHDFSYTSALFKYAGSTAHGVIAHEVAHNLAFLGSDKDRSGGIVAEFSGDVLALAVLEEVFSDRKTDDYMAFVQKHFQTKPDKGGPLLMTMNDPFLKTYFSISEAQRKEHHYWARRILIQMLQKLGSGYDERRLAQALLTMDNMVRNKEIAMEEIFPERESDVAVANMSVFFHKLWDVYHGTEQTYQTKIYEVRQSMGVYRFRTVNAIPTVAVEDEERVYIILPTFEPVQPLKEGSLPSDSSPDSPNTGAPRGPLARAETERRLRELLQRYRTDETLTSDPDAGEDIVPFLEEVAPEDRSVVVDGLIALLQDSVGNVPAQMALSFIAVDEPGLLARQDILDVLFEAADFGAPALGGGVYGDIAASRPELAPYIRDRILGMIESTGNFDLADHLAVMAGSPALQDMSLPILYQLRELARRYPDARSFPLSLEPTEVDRNPFLGAITEVAVEGEGDAARHAMIILDESLDEALLREPALASLERIAAGDASRLTTDILRTAERLSRQDTTDNAIAARLILLEQAVRASRPETAEPTPVGGIDFDPARLNLEIQNNGGGIRFHISPELLEQLQNAPGFIPVIHSIQPMPPLPSFLGRGVDDDGTQDLVRSEDY